MRSASAARFRKLNCCPSAETLLLYREEDLAREARLEVAAHLAGCDFCGAEMELLARHHGSMPEEETAGPIEIPAHMRRLAEALLAEQSFVRAKLARSVTEVEALPVSDAQPLTY